MKIGVRETRERKINPPLTRRFGWALLPARQCLGHDNRSMRIFQQPLEECNAVLYRSSTRYHVMGETAHETRDEYAHNRHQTPERFGVTNISFPSGSIYAHEHFQGARPTMDDVQVVTFFLIPPNYACKTYVYVLQSLLRNICFSLIVMIHRSPSKCQ
jgi:hypothetical protein